MTNTALVAALDAAAPDQERWFAGNDAFTNSLATDSDVETAYYAALDAAAPDQKSWIEGRNALVLEGALVLPGSKSSLKENVTKILKTRAPWSKVILGIIIGALIGIIFAFLVGLLVSNVLTLLVPILWLIQLLLVIAGAAFGYRLASKPKVLVAQKP